LTVPRQVPGSNQKLLQVSGILLKCLTILRFSNPEKLAKTLAGVLQGGGVKSRAFRSFCEQLAGDGSKERGR
jgi:hypothetical protein